MIAGRDAGTFLAGGVARANAAAFFTADQNPYFVNALDDDIGMTGLTPRGSWPLRDQCVGEAAKQIGVWTSCRKGETDAAGSLDEAGGDFQQPQPDGGGFGMTSRMVRRSQ